MLKNYHMVGIFKHYSLNLVEMKTDKLKQNDFDRLVSKILNTPPKQKYQDFDFAEKIFGFDYDSFIDSNFESVDPMTTEEYEFDKIYKSYDEFKQDYPKEAKEFFGWNVKGGDFVFDKNKKGSDFGGLMVKFKIK